MSRTLNYSKAFAIFLSPSDYEDEPENWEDDRWLEPFYLRCGSFVRFGIGGRWGCIGFEINRPATL